MESTNSRLSVIYESLQAGRHAAKWLENTSTLECNMWSMIGRFFLVSWKNHL